MTSSLWNVAECPIYSIVLSLDLGLPRLLLLLFRWMLRDYGGLAILVLRCNIIFSKVRFPQL